MKSSKRFKITIIILFLNFITFWFGIYTGVDLTALGSGLSLINLPLLPYIWGETSRPSDNPPKDKIDKEIIL